MSSVNKSIKVIKRKQRERLTEQKEVPVHLAKTERQLRREMVQNVALWILERRVQAKELACVVNSGRLA